MTNRIGMGAARFALALLLGASGTAMAAVQMLLPHQATAKAAPLPPADLKSIAVPVRFNAAGLLSMALGDEAQLALPNGTLHAYVFDQKKDYGDGIVSWVGYYRDQDQRHMLRAIVTTGPGGSIGLLQTPQGEFRIRPGSGGNDWLVDMKAEGPAHAKGDLGHDTRTPPLFNRATELEPLMQPDFAVAVPGMTVPLSSALPITTKVTTTPSLVTVDMMLVYNQSLATAFGANLPTFLNHLITIANTAFADSKVGIQLRLVDSLLVAYSDNNSDDTALNDITNNAGVFANLEARRTQMGADMVHFYRGGGSGYGGSGVAWAPSSPISDSRWAPYMYSTVNGCWAGCEDIWIHEVGHNMGNQHDRATSAWEGSGQGSYPYSYGFYTCNGKYDASVLSCNPFAGGCITAEPECALGSANNYRDIMAYFGSSTTMVLRFSNPDLDCSTATPGMKCGLADGYLDVGGRPASADTAASMNNNRVGLSALRATVVGGGTTATPTTTAVVSNFNPAQVGSTFTFTGNVTATTGTPTGTMAFKYNGTAVAGCSAVTVSNGTAFCTAAGLPQGPLAITVQFTGTGGFANSTSPVLTQYMLPVPAMVATSPRKVDFDGDGRSDIAWKGPTLDVWGVWLMAGASYGPTAYATPPVTGAVLRGTGDFNGDGRADLLWRKPDGTYAINLMTGTSASAPVTVGTPNSGWDVLAVGDFNGDGKADLLWASLDGRYQVTLMNGTAVASTTLLAPPAAPFFPTFIADFSGEGRDDILWRSADGSLIMMLMNGAANAGQAQLLGPNTGWYPTHVADLNGDGKADILLGKADGSAAAWLMSAGSIIGSAILQSNNGVPNGWSLALVRDLDGDGKADLIWGNANGTYGGWLMNGVTVKPNGYGTILGVANSGWSIVSAGDFNADGKWDLLWRHTDGRFSTWVMNGLSPSSYGSVLGAGTGWDIAP